MSGYAALIAETVPGVDPGHVEAFMRLEYGTLDHLDASSFAREARVAAQCVREAGPSESAALAASYGL